MVSRRPLLTDPQQAIRILGLTAIRHGHRTPPPAHHSIRHVTVQMGHGRNRFVDDNLIWRVFCTGYGVDPLLSDRNVDAVLDMTMPVNTLPDTVRTCDSFCHE